jgi:hypothetical protein
MVIAGMGPWTVTVWLNEWPSNNKQKIEFDKINWSLLNSKLSKAMRKPKRMQVANRYIPPNMVHFEIRSKR